MRDIKEAANRCGLLVAVVVRLGLLLLEGRLVAFFRLWQRKHVAVLLSLT